MTKTLTFSDLADLLAAHDALDPAAHSLLLRRIRLLSGAFLLPLLPPQSGKAQRLDVKGATLAAIFVELIAHGFDIPIAAAVKARLQEEYYTVTNGTRLEQAIAAVRAGKQVTIRIRQMTHRRGGDPRLVIAIDGVDAKPNLRVERTLQAYERENFISGRIETHIDVTAVLAPVLAAIEG